jgi:hypothetical protein
MHDRVIWSEKYGPKTSAICALNDSGSLRIYRLVSMA